MWLQKNFLKCTSVCLHCDSTNCENFETPPDIQLDDHCLDVLEKLLDEHITIENDEQNDNEEIYINENVEEEESDQEDHNESKKRKIE